jgi:hypothetical protein
LDWKDISPTHLHNHAHVFSMVYITCNVSEVCLYWGTCWGNKICYVLTFWGRPNEHNNLNSKIGYILVLPVSLSLMHTQRSPLLTVDFRCVWSSIYAHFANHSIWFLYSRFEVCIHVGKKSVASILMCPIFSGVSGPYWDEISLYLPGLMVCLFVTLFVYCV